MRRKLGRWDPEFLCGQKYSDGETKVRPHCGLGQSCLQSGGMGRVLHGFPRRQQADTLQHTRCSYSLRRHPASVCGCRRKPSIIPLSRRPPVPDVAGIQLELPAGIGKADTVQVANIRYPTDGSSYGKILAQPGSPSRGQPPLGATRRPLRTSPSTTTRTLPNFPGTEL